MDRQATSRNENGRVGQTDESNRAATVRERNATRRPSFPLRFLTLAARLTLAGMAQLPGASTDWAFSRERQRDGPTPSCATVLCAAALLSCLPLTAQEPLKIGYYGPADPAHPVGGTVWEGTLLAVEEANAGPGPAVRLVQEWDENPWSGGAAGVVRMAYHENVAAILGSINGDATHLAEQVVAKARLPLIDPASTDPTVNAAFVPWMFSVTPDDRALMKALAADVGEKRFILVTGIDHDSRTTAKEFLRLLRYHGPEMHFEFDRPDSEVVERVAELKPSAIVLIAGAVASGELVRALRAAVPDAVIYGAHHCGRLTFIRTAGSAANGVRFPLPGSLAPGFVAKFFGRFGHDPDYAAGYAYDAARIVISAITQAGHDREGLREAILQLSPFSGSTGSIRWNKLGRNESVVRMATITCGKVRMDDRASGGQGTSADRTYREIKPCRDR